MAKKHQLSAASLAVVLSMLGVLEGNSLRVYRDIVGIPTVCKGHTGPDVIVGETWTEDRCKEITFWEVRRQLKIIDRCVQVELSQPVLVSAVLLAYNIGEGNFCASTAVRMFNAGDIPAGCKAYGKFVCVTTTAGKGDKTGPCKRAPEFNKRVVQGLVNRRATETGICLKAEL